MCDKGRKDRFTSGQKGQSLAGGEHVRNQIAVGEHRTFWNTRGTGRVNDRCDVIATDCACLASELARAVLHRLLAHLVKSFERHDFSITGTRFKSHKVMCG